MKMETEDLKEYLGIVVDLEKNIYLQNQLIDAMRGRMAKLGISKTLEMPIPPVAQGSGATLQIIIIGTVMSLLITAVAAFVAFIVLGVVGSFLTVIGSSADVINLIFVIVVVLVFVGSMVFYIWVAISGRHDYENAKEKYTQEYLDYQNAMDQDKNRLKREEQQKAALRRNINQVEKTRACLKIQGICTK